MPRLPFILLSLFGAEHDTADRAYRPDAIGLKPIRAALLTALVEQVLTGKMPQHQPSGSSPQALPTFRGHKILLVEDNPVNQRVAQRMLQKLAAEVTIANNGAEALERIAAIDLRCRADGLPDAGDGRIHRDPAHSRDGAQPRRASGCPSLRSPPMS